MTLSLFESSLVKLFGFPSLVNIGGPWKTGKTDLALLIAETLLSLNQRGIHSREDALPSKVASNIETEDKRVEFVPSLEELRYWLHGDNRVKLFILDEANVHAPRRRAMSTKNVEIIKILPEVSKAHARMIVVGQELEKIDSELMNPTWCRAVFYKRRLKNATLISSLFSKERHFKNLPPTTIPFDPYRIAPFTERPLNRAISLFKDEEMSKLWAWCNGTPTRNLGMHNMELNRMVRAFVKRILEPKARELKLVT